MKRAVLIEGVLLLVISLVIMAEALRLIIYQDLQQLYDVVGPGFYILFLGIALMATGIVHLIVNYKKSPITGKVAVRKLIGNQAFSSIVACALYIFLIGIAGYLLATLVFFIVEFRVVGVRSWPINLILALCLTAAYYIVFVQCCNMVFPEGLFFG